MSESPKTLRQAAVELLRELGPTPYAESVDFGALGDALATILGATVRRGGRGR